MLAILGSGVVVATVLPMGIGWDFANFYDAARKVAAGQVGDLYNPRALIDGAPPQGGLAFFGFPLSAVLLTPLAYLPPRWALVAFKLQSALFLLLALTVLHRHLARRAVAGRSAFSTHFLLAALLFQPFWTIFRVGGQTTPLVLACFTLAYLAHVRDRPLPAAALVTLAVLFKPAFGTAALVLALLSGRRWLAWAALLGGGIAALSLGALGLPAHLEFLREMQAGAGASVWWVWNSAVTVPLENLRLLGDPAPASAVRPLALLLAVHGVRLLIAGTLVGLLLKRRRVSLPPEVRRADTFLLAVSFALFLAPVVWEHYLSLLFLPVAVLLASLPRAPRPVRVALAALLGTALFQNIVVTTWLNETLSPSGPLSLVLLGLLKAAPLLLGFGLMVGARSFFLSAVREVEATT